MDKLDLNDKVIKGQKARALIDDPLLQEAFAELREALEERALSTNVTDVAAVQDVIRCKQLLEGLERKLYSIVADGTVAVKELEFLNAEQTVSQFRR